MTRTLLLVVPIVLATACGPLVMIPGGALSGSVAATPSNWSFSDAFDTIQLETNPEDPYSVNVWGVGVGNEFFIAAGDKTSQWAENIRANPLVRVRIDGTIYELRGEERTDARSRDAFLAAAKTKYDFEPSEEDAAKATIFAFGPR